MTRAGNSITTEEEMVDDFYGNRMQNDWKKEKEKSTSTLLPNTTKEISMDTAQHSRLRHIRHVDKDIVRRVTV